MFLTVKIPRNSIVASDVPHIATKSKGQAQIGVERKRLPWQSFFRATILFLQHFRGDAMPTTDERLELLERQCHRLERANRCFKLAGGLAVITVVILMGMGANAIDSVKVVEAERFVVRDKNGKIRAVLSSSSDDVSFLRLYDSSELERVKERVKVGVSEIKLDDKGKRGDGAGISLFDKKGTLRVGMEITPFNCVQLDVFDEEENPRIGLLGACKPDDFAKLYIGDKLGERFDLSGHSDRSVSMHFIDKTGQRNWVLVKDKMASWVSKSGIKLIRRDSTCWGSQMGRHC